MIEVQRLTAELAISHPSVNVVLARWDCFCNHISMAPRYRDSQKLSDLGKAVIAFQKAERLGPIMVAELSGMTQRTLSDWMGIGKSHPAVVEYLSLCALVGGSPEAYLGCAEALANLRNPVCVEEMVRRVASPRVLKRFLAAQEQKAAQENQASPDESIPARPLTQTRDVPPHRMSEYRREAVQ